MIDLEELLKAGNTIQIKPRGYSMYPLLVNGRDEAIIEPNNGENIKKGDVILFRRYESILVLHRVYKIDDKGFYFVGDNQVDIEGPIHKDQIRGKMIAIKRKGKIIDVNNFIYKVFTSLWLILRPFRPFISHLIHNIKTVLKK